jgi:NDP-sugar pyrophosphorylase family protein
VLKQNKYIYIGIFCFSLTIGIGHYFLINAQPTEENSTKTTTITKIENIEPVYIATGDKCSSSKQVESEPYVVIEEKCTEQATIKSIGKVLNNLTFLNTQIDNNTIFGQGYGKIVSEDGQMIGWSSFDVNVFDTGHPGYRGIIYFNSTMDEKFSSLNNTIGVFRSEADTGKSIWLLE